MRTIRASEIGTFLYCQRAWRFRLDGFEPENQVELAGGTELHYRHGRTVMMSGCFRVLAYVLILAAFVVLAFYATGQIF